MRPRQAVYNFDVYLGKEEGNVEHNLARRVVRKLVSPIGKKCHHLYMDNFYCDPHLFLELETKDILACGTIRANRKGFAKDIVLTRAMERRMNHLRSKTIRNDLPVTHTEPEGMFTGIYG